MTDVFDDHRAHDGLSYDEYRAYWRDQKDEPLAGKDPDERRTLHFLTYNWERQAQVHEAYTPSEDLRDAMQRIETPQRWMVLTEPWCGDSAFLLPVVAEAAALHNDVTLRILLRDKNLDVMDQYLTGGSRSIPKLVVFSPEGDEQFTWGPRPRGAQRRFEDLSEARDDKMEVIEGLVEYYEDGGWREADDELAAAVRSSTRAEADASQ